MTADEKAAEAMQAEQQSILMAEAVYHFNAMKALSVLGVEGIGVADRDSAIQVSIAWSLLGLLRAKIREVPS